MPCSPDENLRALSIGIPGYCCYRSSYQRRCGLCSRSYSKSSHNGAQQPKKPPIRLSCNSDVRRMLLTIKAMTEGQSAFSTYVGSQLISANTARRCRDQKEGRRSVALADAGRPRRSFNRCGSGELHPWAAGIRWPMAMCVSGSEQLVRDVRHCARSMKAPNGIQGAGSDGPTRRLPIHGAFRSTCFSRKCVTLLAGMLIRQLAEFVQRWPRPIDNLEELTGVATTAAKTNANEIGAASVEYLHVFR